MSYDDANEFIEELFESLLWIYQIGLETTMTGSDFIFDSVNFMYITNVIKENLKVVV